MYSQDETKLVCSDMYLTVEIFLHLQSEWCFGIVFWMIWVWRTRHVSRRYASILRYPLLCRFNKLYYNVTGLRTRVHGRSFGVHNVVASTSVCKHTFTWKRKGSCKVSIFQGLPSTINAITLLWNMNFGTAVAHSEVFLKNVSINS